MILWHVNYASQTRVSFMEAWVPLVLVVLIGVLPLHRLVDNRWAWNGEVSLIRLSVALYLHADHALCRALRCAVQVERYRQVLLRRSCSVHCRWRLCGRCLRALGAPDVEHSHRLRGLLFAAHCARQR